MLASDLINPAFENPTNPDNILSVEFYWHEPIDKWTSELNPEFPPVKLPKQAFVRIMKPGDDNTILETPVREDHKKRFPAKWLYFQMKEGLVNATDVPGWKIEEWDLDPETVHQLKYKRFMTVEQIAGASDAQVQGMGMGGLALREKAKVALRDKVSVVVQDDMKKKDDQIAALEAQMAELRAMITGKAAVETPIPVEETPQTEPTVKIVTNSGNEVIMEVPVFGTPTPEKKRRGRPPKVKAA